MKGQVDCLTESKLSVQLHAQTDRQTDRQPGFLVPQQPNVVHDME